MRVKKSTILNSGVSVFEGVVKGAINGMYCLDNALCPHYSVSPHFGVSGERGSTVVICCSTESNFWSVLPLIEWNCTASNKLRETK